MISKNKTLFIIVTGLVAIILCFVGTPKGAEKKTNSKEDNVIEAGKLVKVNYTLTADGKVIDSSIEGKPFEFRAGSKQVIPGFEEALLGMKAGEKKSFQVSPDKGYGEENPKGIQKVERDKLPKDINPEVGMTLSAQMPNGQTIPARIVEVKDDIVILNFNHPLSGKILNFEVEIVEIN